MFTLHVQLAALLLRIFVLFLIVAGLQLGQKQQQADQRNELDDFFENDQLEENLSNGEKVQFEFQLAEQPILLAWTFPASCWIISAR